MNETYTSWKILIISFFLVINCTIGLIHRKLNLFDEFSSYDVSKVTVYNEFGNQINSTYDVQNQRHLPKIRVVITYSGNLLSLDLKINRILISPKYVEKISEPGLKPDYMNSHCFYIGHVDVGHINSIDDQNVVAVSTCSGLRAYIAMSGDIYHIEPGSSDINGLHYLFKESDSHNGYRSVCDGQAHYSDTHVHKMQGRRKRGLEWPYDANNQTLIVELYIVNDHSQFVSQGRDVDTVIQRTKSIVNIVSSLYRSLNIYVALVGVEVWSDVDRIEMANSSDKTMNNFLEYRRQYINPTFPNDNAQMISGRSFGEGIVGKASIMTICSWQYSGGINLDHSHLVGRIATTMAHEIGHNFGMTHDTEASRCPDEKCIMSPSSGGSSPTKWSESSKEELSDALHQGMHHCLHNIPSKLYGNDPVCGDGFVDKGEQCDCGLPEDCTSLCCNASTCKFLLHAQCSSGSCCDLKTCQLKPKSHECRPGKDDCDLIEYCDGFSEFCPFDVFKHDGFKCSVMESQAFCFSGRCRTHDTQCKLLWGQSGKSSHDRCYIYYNMLGNSKGNCGLKWDERKTFMSCESGDEMCGMLHCQHTSEKLMFWKESLAYDMPDSYIMINNIRYDCKAAILDVGLDSDNPGLAPDGSKCGVNKMCISQKCMSVEEVKKKLNCSNCHGNGVCNSLGQCHCDNGWSAPYCNVPGAGGSLHSGPAVNIKSNVRTTIALCLVFFVIFPITMVTIILVYKRRTLILKRIGLSKSRSTSLPPRPIRPPPRAPSVQRTSSSFRRPLPPPYKPPSPPRKIASFSTYDAKNEFQLPPRISYNMISSKFDDLHPPSEENNSFGLKEVLSELQQIDFLNKNEDGVDVPEHDESIPLKDNVDASGQTVEDRKLVPFRKAPPPPPPFQHESRIMTKNFKPPIRPTPPKPRKV